MAIRVSLDGLFCVKPNPIAILNAAIASGKIQENTESEEGLQPVAAESLSGKIVGLYFSAHWCPPCKGFTPHLAQKYKELVDAGHPIEIIFISSDSSAAEAREYFSEMPWKMLDYECRDEKGRLGKAYSVAGIPTLVLLDESLQLITANGRDAIMTCEFDKLKSYESDLIAAKAAISEKMESSPETVTITQHSHPLKKMASVYRGQYGCNVCHGSGEGWVYHCDLCDFDAHPKCACPSHFA
jgi:nucleoredoxin